MDDVAKNKPSLRSFFIETRGQDQSSSLALPGLGFHRKRRSTHANGTPYAAQANKISATSPLMKDIRRVVNHSFVCASGASSKYYMPPFALLSLTVRGELVRKNDPAKATEHQPRRRLMLDRDEELLNSKQVAIILDMSPDTVNEFARKNILPAFKKGKQWRFRKRDISVFFKKQSRDIRDA